MIANIFAARSRRLIILDQMSAFNLNVIKKYRKRRIRSLHLRLFLLLIPPSSCVLSKTTIMSTQIGVICLLYYAWELSALYWWFKVLENHSSKKLQLNTVVLSRSRMECLSSTFQSHKISCCFFTTMKTHSVRLDVERAARLPSLPKTAARIGITFPTAAIVGSSLNHT